ncbi:hypothetical protein HML84_19620 [Alcanivorax sp. IO_7]|nr:hypothetical protein HML84_19620 [Alcanivorax sp. IO_7]
MLKEIVIWPTEENKGHERGAFFEKLANQIFSTQRYKVSGNVHVTGQEFDLECEHIDRENERCLVECKAKQSLSSDEIKNLYLVSTSIILTTASFYIPEALKDKLLD